LQIVRRASFVAMPWKNGGGTTYELKREPDWRVSIAHVAASGPFSEFPDRRRHLALLQGAGVRLRFADGRRVELRRCGDLVEFDGAGATQCELLDGECFDLNLMVARSLAVAVRVHVRGEAPALQVADGATGLMVALDAVAVMHDQTGADVVLQPWELAVLPPGTVRVAAPGPLFFATLHG
jgi:environmental stress-induced protein Ves